MKRDAEALGKAADRAAERFGEAFRARVAIARDRDVSGDLVSESRPVAQALIEGLGGAQQPRTGDPVLREATALASLLGRRAATLGLTPSGALQIVPALLEAVATDAERDPSALLEPLRAVCLEGYVAAREDTMREHAAERAAGAIPVVRLAPTCFAVFPTGDQDAEPLERVFEDLGRRLLDRGAAACLVHAAGLRDPAPERARRLFAIHGTCMMLGVTCVFSGIDEGWLAAAREAGLDPSELRIEPDFASGLAVALEACELELRPRRGLGGVLRRLVGQR